MKLNLALLSIEYPPDPFSAGIGSYSAALAKALTQQGHKVHVITRAPAQQQRDSRADEAGVTVHRLVPNRPTLPEQYKLGQIGRLLVNSLNNEWRYRQKIATTLRQLIAHESINIIEASDYLAEGMRYRPRDYPHIPYIIRLHTPFAYAERIESHVPELLRRIMRELERRHFLQASHITAPSQGSAEVFRKELALGNVPIHIIPNLHSMEVTDSTITSQPPTEKESLPSVLFVGRINKWKGVDILCRAIPEVVERYPWVHFNFVGGDHVTIEGFRSGQTYLYSLVAEKYHQHMHFRGRVGHAEVQKYLQQAHICVFPSRFDNFPYTCLEAMSQGKAIVGSNNGGMRDLLAEGEAGLLYTPPHHQELAQHIMRLLADEPLRQRLAAKARARAANVYNPETILEATLAFYQQAIHDVT